LEEAPGIIERDPGIGYILIGYSILKPAEADMELLSFIRRIHNKNPEIRFIGYSTEDRKREFQDVNIQTFAKKPWSVKQLIDLIRSEEISNQAANS